MTNIVDKLKIALGRKLSESQIRLAKSGIDNFHVWNFIREEGNKIVVGRTYFEHATTHDLSLVSAKLHTGNYPIKTVDSEYDSDGLIVRKKITTNEPAGPLTSYKEVVYEPAGKIFGKTVKKWGGFFD